MEQHASAIFLSILNALAGGINAWQNVSIKLAIAELRNELFQKTASQDTHLAVMEAAARKPVVAVMSQVMTPAVKSRLAIALVKASQKVGKVGGVARLSAAAANQRVDEWAKQLAAANAPPVN